MGTVDKVDLVKTRPTLSHPKQKVQSVSQESDVFARIRSELGDIAFRAKESVMIESLKDPISTVTVEDTPAAEVEEDFQSKINKRLQSMTLTETPNVLKAVSSPSSSFVKNDHLSNDENLKNERFASSPVKVMVSPNYFNMRGPWLEHVLDFHSVKNTGSPLLGTADKFEFQSRTPIADAIKLVSAYSDKLN